jgi:ribonuclease HI
MDIIAIVEQLGVLPREMLVWASTDSANVKNGITQWMKNLINNNLRTSDGKPVATRSLWKKLIELVQMHKRVEWPWVKAHSCLLLNECSAELAIGGVMNEKHP